MTEQEKKEQLELDTLKKKSPAALPDNPSAAGWTSAQIKAKFYEGLIYLYSLFKENRQANAEKIEEIKELAKKIVDASQYVDKSISDLIGQAPENLNTLEKIVNFISTLASEDYVDQNCPLLVDEVLTLPVNHSSVVVGYENSIDLASLNKKPAKYEHFWGICKTVDNYVFSFAAKCVDEDYTDGYVGFEFVEVVLLHDGSIDKKVENKAEKNEIPKKVSELDNDSKFITNLVDNLVNYYKKSETYSAEEINNLILSIPKFAIQVVATLPATNISDTTVYLLKTSSETSNLYEEYIYVNDSWELLGTAKVKLDDYALKTELLDVKEWISSLDKRTLNIECGEGIGSIQAKGDTSTEGSSADTAVYENENGELVFNFNADFNTNAAVEYERVYGEPMPLTFPYGAAGKYSQVLNGKGYTKGKRSRVDGTTCLVFEDYGYAGGNTCVVMAGAGSANGIATVVSGEGARTDGFKTIARAPYSHASGKETITDVNAEAGFTTGYKTKVTAKYSAAFGYYSSSTADNAFSANQNTKANHKNAATFGLSTQSTRENQMVVGQYNNTSYDTDALFIVGTGDSNSERYNGFIVHQDGRATVRKNPSKPKDVATKQYVDDREPHMHSLRIDTYGTNVGEIYLNLYIPLATKITDTSILYNNVPSGMIVCSGFATIDNVDRIVCGLSKEASGFRLYYYHDTIFTSRTLDTTDIYFEDSVL